MTPRMPPMDGDTKPCPQCRGTLVFRTRHPVLAGRMTLRDLSPPPDGITYEAAWVCCNERCDYRELVGA